MTETQHPPSPTTSKAAEEEEAPERALKRAQVWNDQLIHQPVESKLHWYLIFEDDLEKEQYKNIHKLSIVVGKSIPDSTLETLHIKTGVLKLIYAIG